MPSNSHSDRRKPIALPFLNEELRAIDAARTLVRVGPKGEKPQPRSAFVRDAVHAHIQNLNRNRWRPAKDRPFEKPVYEVIDPRSKELEPPPKG